MISKKKCIGFSVIFIIIVSSVFISGAKMEYVIPEYEKISDEITARTAKKLSRKYQLDPIGSGGSMMHDVEMLALSFNCYRSLSINESRELVINCVNEYIKSINENEDIRPYLHDYPFSAQNIQIKIFFFGDENFQKIPPGKINVVSTGKKRVRYYTDSDEDEYKLETLHQETYEEALRIVRELGRLAP
ncbi:hypothetical protein [Simkania sp.]|uniref:hypothetical protein n=1 Tax=Simkania sp. TaxID=34094 RepID=UPI003B52D81B